MSLQNDGLSYGLIFKETIKKALKIKGFSSCDNVKYGLKAARRAPQFSKR